MLNTVVISAVDKYNDDNCIFLLPLYFVFQRVTNDSIVYYFVSFTHAGSQALARHDDERKSTASSCRERRDESRSPC